MAWKSLKIEEKLFAYRIIRNFQDIPNSEHEHNEKALTFWLSDFRVIYKERLELRELLDRAKVENPFVEYEPGIVLNTILNGESPQLQFICEEPNAVFRLTSKSYVSQLPFHFYWRLEQQSADVFFVEITRVLFGSLLDASRQRVHLLDVIQSKDLEIEQYKIDGAELIRKQLGTKPFVRNAFELSAQSTEVVGLLQIATDESRAMGISTLWSAADKNNTTPDDKANNILVNPIKRASSTSPGKPIKRSTKELFARSKIQTGPDALMKYGDSEEVDDDEKKGESTVAAISPQQDQTTTGYPKTSPSSSAHKTTTNVRKIKTKLNL